MTHVEHALSTFEPLRQQLLAAAKEFAGAQPLAALLSAIVEDVQRACAEPLEIFPVCHHSPAAAVHVIRRLQERPPRVIFIELCEDLRPLLDKLRDCKLPVALQAFAGQVDGFPRSWSPLSVVAPLTEFSAEFQAIAFALDNPDTELVFVDRSVDHVFQWMPQKEDELEKHLGEEAEPEGDDPPPSHGAALGVQLGDVEPTLEQFTEFLLRNAQVRSFAEWWDQYVEQVVLPADLATYRQVLFLVGSILRRLGRREADRENDRQRERFMWTRMREHLAARQLPPEEGLHICGAVHAVSEIAEFGSQCQSAWVIPPRTPTAWLYGVIPSSHAAIDWQFHFPPGTVTLSEASWEKSLRALDVRPFVLGKAGAKPRKAPARVGVAAAAPASADAGQNLFTYLTRPPQLVGEDEEQLLAWSVGIVELARNNGYLATTADSIAVYHTALMLASLRNRRHPTPYDFRDAAITCLEKDRTPKKRDVRRLCEILLGGDRRGQVGLDALPPLARDVYDRLDAIRSLDSSFNLQSTRIQRALLDLRQRPDLKPVSDLLWKLRYLFGPAARLVRPIMGERRLGVSATQESWDIEIGKNQTPLLQLAYEGVTVEHVLERRLKAKAFSPSATPVTALEAAEECLLYLGSPRLTEEIGDHAVGLLVAETGAQSAPEVFERMRRLVHHFRSTPEGLPGWAKRFVTTGYSHYTTLLPTAFSDRGTTPKQLAGMLAFIFNLESLALSLGCDRSQLLIAVRQSAGATDPNKIGLLWAAEWVLGLRTVEQIRDFFSHLFENRMALAAFPSYINGFLLALEFTSLVMRLVVELLSRAFERLPDAVLLPWMPGLILALRPHAGSVLPTLLKEAAASFPKGLPELRDWQPAWQRVAPAVAAAASTAAVPTVERSEQEEAVFALLREMPEGTEALAALLGVEPVWAAVAPAGAGEMATQVTLTGPEAGARELLEEHGEGARALALLLGV